MVDEAKILDVVSISGENVKKFDGERSYLSTGNLDFNKISNLEIVTYENKPSRANQTVNIGEVIFAKMKDTKKTLVINKTNKNIIVSTGFYVLKPSKEILPQYLYHYLNSSYFLNQKNRLSKGATQSALNNEGLANIKIRMYNLKVQEKVVRVLDKAQELIDKRKEQIEVLDELVKSRFIEMFGTPSKNEKNWEISEIGKYLDVLTDYHSNGSYETLRDNVTLLDTKGYALMVRTTDLENNNFEKGVKYIDEHAYNYLEKSKVFGGEVIINKIGSAGKVYLMLFLNKPVSLAMNQFMLRFNEDKVNHIFLYNLLLTSYMESKIKEKVRGAVTKTITKDAVRKINIIVPPIRLQNQFANFVKQVNSLKFEMETSLKELEDNFNSLMQKAFKGELFN
ncbi:TPA: restriction endonuclease subunit S [Clostridioides difficile]|nr:restriction endonuclease subunit S [Clostridioides difficile]